ncbi:MAG: CRISPR system precrRNA processing endoribonuclease RAMP protein Cas6 [Chloroflexi bacterium]|nr:CRISPR system precrRNA processing endoribonuclease RAMP protein Cas6 [Chloroflexota bacterium]
MLTSIVLHLQAQTNGHIQGGTGRAVHGFWNKQWAETAPEVGDKLHKDSGRRPFTLSPLMGLPRPRRGNLTISANDKAWLRISVLEPGLSQQLLETWLPRLPAQIKLAQIPWAIQKINLSSQENFWAGQTTCQKLIDRHLGTLNPPDEWRLTFLTPTSFHGAGKTYLPFPLPDSLVNSWAQRWQTFSSKPLNGYSRSRLREHLLVSRYDLKTIPYRYGDYSYIGCMGQMTLRGKELTPEERAIVTLLADYAFFAGSGSHTTQGMGMTYLQDKP